MVLSSQIFPLHVDVCHFLKKELYINYLDYIVCPADGSHVDESWRRQLCVRLSNDCSCRLATIAILKNNLLLFDGQIKAASNREGTRDCCQPVPVEPPRACAKDGGDEELLGR